MDNEDELLRTVAQQNARTILLARQRAEDELFRTKEALTESEATLRAIFHQAAVGIAVAELDGHFLDVNKKFSEILGYSADELRRLTFLEITHPDDLTATQTASRQLLAGSRPDYCLEKRFLRKGGSSVWTLTTVTMLKDAAGHSQRFIGVVEDITPRKRTEGALREKSRNLALLAVENARLYEAAQKAAEDRKALLESERIARAAVERANDLKDEFLTTLSHELRTPLSAILGWSQVLRTAPRDETDYTKGLEAIERNARVQTQLIDDLLDMSRISSGKLRLDVQPLEPVSFVEAAIETVRPAADAKGIRLERFLDPASGPISGDPGRLQQVVWNLLSNAIKFTPKEGKVQVLLQRVESHIEIIVADTGVGINPEFIPHLFERFRQGDASTTRRFGGLGLGLSIVKNLVELHGGFVRVDSPGEGQGTSVVVHLPLTVVHRTGDPAGRQHPKARIPIQPSVAAAELAGLRVLVVDDQADARDLIKRVLEDCAAEVVTAGTAHEALELVEARRPDVIVSDIGMPDTDGFELLRRVRALGPERGGRAHAIALTAFARSEDRTRALRAGFLVHVSKPVDPSELIATVASVAGRVDDDPER